MPESEGSGSRKGSRTNSRSRTRTRTRTNSRTGSRTGSRGEGTKQKATQQSTHVLLMRRGCEGYFHYFDKAGYRFIDANKYLDDLEVENMIHNVESANRIQFKKEIRCQVWKALRYQWFQGPHDIPFCMKEAVPKLYLPKRHFQHVDAMIPHAQLESDRQRQVQRVVKRTYVGGKKSVETKQFEIYRREFDMWYEYKDLRRCVDEWQQRNPRTMLREDPREEVLKTRARQVMELASRQLVKRQKERASLVRLSWVFFAARLAFALLTFVMFAAAYYRWQGFANILSAGGGGGDGGGKTAGGFSPLAQAAQVLNMTTIYTPASAELWQVYVISSNQFRSALSFFVAFFFLHSVLGRAHGDPQIARLKKIWSSLDRLLEQISDFRVESEPLRMVDQAARQKEMEFIAQEAQKALKREEAAARSQLLERKKAKKTMNEAQEDHALRAWCGDDAKVKGGKIKVDVKAVQNLITESYKRLPEIDAGKHSGDPGGTRNRVDKENLQSWVPDTQLSKLCVRVGPRWKQAEEDVLHIEDRHGSGSYHSSETSGSRMGSHQLAIAAASGSPPSISVPPGSGTPSEQGSGPPLGRSSSPDSNRLQRYGSHSPQPSRSGSRDVRMGTRERQVQVVVEPVEVTAEPRSLTRDRGGPVVAAPSALRRPSRPEGEIIGGRHGSRERMGSRYELERIGSRDEGPLRRGSRDQLPAAAGRVGSRDSPPLGRVGSRDQAPGGRVGSRDSPPLERGVGSRESGPRGAGNAAASSGEAPPAQPRAEQPAAPKLPGAT